jgi:tetratricopeptide (TPR) repeat protein
MEGLTEGFMGPKPLAINAIVAAFLAAMGFSAPLPAPAQEVVPAFPVPEEPAPEPPAEPRQTPEEREADLLRQLAEAPDPHAASLIESQLKGMWSRSGSASVDLLWKRGQDALEAGSPDEAIEHFTAAIDWSPDFGEAYLGRAIAFYLTNRAGPALGDLRQALALNPHQWEAMQGFAVLLEEIGEEEDALEVWRRVHDMHPQNPEAAAAVDRLELQLQGRTL